MQLNGFTILMTLILCYSNVLSQFKPNDTALYAAYPIINQQAVKLIGDSIAFQEFASKLHSFTTANHPAFHVLHIGDSHVQAGFFTEPIRELFSSIYGYGGPGVVFPYQVAKTNGPPGFSSSSDYTWTAKRNVKYNIPLPTGLCGHTIYSTNPSASFNIRFNEDSSYNRIRNLTIFHSNRDTNFNYIVTGDDSIIAHMDSSFQDIRATRFIFSKDVSRIRVSNNKTDSKQVSSTITGMYCNNGNSNTAITSVIGVNGARYNDYMSSDWFIEQVSHVAPQLIILSLGTNESFEYNKLNLTQFASTIDSMVSRLKNLPSMPIILLTTPPAVCRSKRVSKRIIYIPNTYTALVRQVILDQAAKNHLLAFDLYKAMGGEKSMKWWALKHMTDKRQIHFTKPAYRISGSLLASALARLMENQK